MKTTDREVLRRVAHYLRSVRAQWTDDGRWESEEPAAAGLLAEVERQLADTGPAAWAPMPKLMPLDPELATLHPVCSVCGRLVDEDGGCHC